MHGIKKVHQADSYNDRSMHVVWGQMEAQQQHCASFSSSPVKRLFYGWCFLRCV